MGYNFYYYAWIIEYLWYYSPTLRRNWIGRIGIKNNAIFNDLCTLSELQRHPIILAYTCVGNLSNFRLVFEVCLLHDNLLFYLSYYIYMTLTCKKITVPVCKRMFTVRFTCIPVVVGFNIIFCLYLQDWSAKATNEVVWSLLYIPLRSGMFAVPTAYRQLQIQTKTY